LLARPLFLKSATPSKIVGTQRVAVTKANTTCGHAFGWGNGAQALMKRMSVCHMPLLCSLYLFDITKTIHSQLQMYSLCGIANNWTAWAVGVIVFLWITAIRNVLDTVAKEGQRPT